MIAWQSSPRAAPGPEGLPVLGSILDLRKDTLGFFDRARRYGPIYSFKMASPVGVLLVHVVAHPDHVRHVLKDNHAGYRKSGAFDRFGSVIGNGLLTSEGEFWRRQRRLVRPAFHRERLAMLSGEITRATEQVLEARWEPLSRRGQGALDIAEEMAGLTLTIVGRALLSTDLANEASKVGRAVNYLRRYMDRRIKAIAVVPENVPTPKNRRFKESLRVLDEVVYGIVEEHRRSGEDAGDLVSMLAAARDEETGEGMTPKQLRDEVLTIMIAGHETTAAALSWAWCLLSEHPAVLRRMRSELDEVLAGRVPTYEDLPALAYTTMVFKETLRLYPPAWIIPRVALRDDRIAGYVIPKGSRVVTSPYVTHRDPALWDNPEGFDPERFAPEREEGRPEFAYFPFGGGPRRCVGRNFAMMEGTLILATIAQRCDLQLLPGSRVEPEATITLRPRNRVFMTVKVR
jgi:cytochrome P450